MRRIVIALGLMLLATGAWAGHGSHSRGSYTNIGDGEDCTDRHFRFNGRRAFVEEEVIEAGNLRTLKVNTESSPVTIVGGNSGGYTIVACKAAENAEDLDDIRVTV